VAEQVRRHVEAIEAAHIAHRIDPAKIHGGHGANLAIIQQKSTN